MDKKISKRAINWDQEEKDVLSQLVLDKLEIIENSKIDNNTNKKKKEAWNSVHTLFNACSKTERTVEQMQAQWRKVKSVAKTKNSSFIKQMKQTRGGPPPEPLNSVEEQLVARLPRHFENDHNVYDSNATISEKSELEANQQKATNDGDEFFYIFQEIMSSDGEKDYSKVIYEKKKISPKRKIIKKDDESSKRIKLLEVSSLQKETEMEYSKFLFEAKKSIYEKKNKLLELQISQMNEEHSLKVSKLKLDLESFKKQGFFK